MAWSYVPLLQSNRLLQAKHRTWHASSNTRRSRRCKDTQLHDLVTIHNNERTGLWYWIYNDNDNTWIHRECGGNSLENDNDTQSNQAYSTITSNATTNAPVTSAATPFYSRETSPPQWDSVALSTWRWCTHFVVPHHLCPWAAASVQTPHAVHIYVVPTSSWSSYDHHAPAVYAAAQRMQDHLQQSLLDPHTAISFLVFPLVATDEDTIQNDFADFYDWYVDLEEEYLSHMQDGDENPAGFPLHPGATLTLAPFHPGWSYASQNDIDSDESDSDDSDSDESTPLSNEQQAVLSLEKQSPHPTVSLVASAVIDAAGPEATARIAQHNQRMLTSKSLEEWHQLYQHAITNQWQ
jgi:hypothetical protein